MSEKAATLADLEDLNLADLEMSDLEVHAVRDAVALPETGASASTSVVWEWLGYSSCAAQVLQ
ncbi:thiazolylpeptide-type bacteriocin [Micromonospora sp. NBC_01412]|uniref:thiazolylpeptide-type bacteriocin n=1 Tax=Micromonospora sp. NBC_01412 TaxID=2903590 RepID=UPI0032448344